MRRFRKKTGYTMLELAIAAGVLAFVFASTIAVVGQCFRYCTDMRRASQSWQISQQKIEDLRLMSWAQLQALPSTSYFTDPNDTAGIFQGMIQTLGSDTINSTNRLMRVTVTVTYTNQTFGVITNALTTIFSSGGLNQYLN